ARGHFVAEVGAGASLVFDYNLMTPDFRELVGEDTGDGVRRSSRGHRHDDAHRGHSRGFCAHAAAPARWGASSNPADRTSKQRRVGMVASRSSILRYPAILAQRECRDDGCSTEKPQAAMSSVSGAEIFG